MSRQFSSQREAARFFIAQYCDEKGIEVEGDMKQKLDKNAQATIARMMAVSFCNGEIPMKSCKYETEDDAAKYFKGQVNDTLRKDTNVNGGEEYVAKNPGKLKGSRDAQMKNLKLAKKQYAGTPAEAEIDECIAKRQAELDAAKAAKTNQEIDWSQLPEALQNLKPEA